MNSQPRKNILERRKEIEQELTDMQKIISMFDDGDPMNLSNVLELVTDAWNYFPHKALGGLSPVEKV